MKTFDFKAECKFEAENLDDAFQKLIDHFTDLINHKDSDLFRCGDVSGISGDLDTCCINSDNRTNGISIIELIV